MPFGMASGLGREMGVLDWVVSCMSLRENTGLIWTGALHAFINIWRELNPDRRNQDPLSQEVLNVGPTTDGYSQLDLVQGLNERREVYEKYRNILEKTIKRPTATGCVSLLKILVF